MKSLLERIDNGGGIIPGVVNLEKVIDEYDYQDKTYDEKSMRIYYIKRLISLLNDDWSADSAIYDLDNWDANLKYFYDRLAKEPDRQFLIPVDFHS